LLVERKKVLRSLILKCKIMEHRTKKQKDEIKETIKDYDKYMRNFSEYVDFKQMNPYSEKDSDFERGRTPFLNK
jgi:hypothetical protein